MIQVENLTKVFGEAPNQVHALDAVNLRIEPGEILAVVGQSGSGKSTLVRCLTLLEHPTSGRVIVGDQVVTELNERELRTARRAIGQVFQHANLLDNRTAKRNVEYPLEIAGWGTNERETRAEELLRLVGLGDRLHNYPSQLSGGQLQRVGIARALAAKPGVLLCDEPTSALDPATTEELLELLVQLRDELGVTILIITHDLSVVRRIADRVAVLEHGKIVDHGTVEEVATRRGSSLLGDLIADGPLAESELRVTGGAILAETPFISQLAMELGSEVRLLAGGTHAIGARRIVKAKLGFAGRAERERAAAWLTGQEFDVEVAR